MTDIKTNQYWLSAVEDFILFRKGKIDAATLAERNPEFKVRVGSAYTAFKERVDIIVPEGCPLQIIPKLALAAQKENGDVNRIECEICIAYQPAWNALGQWSKLKEICETQKSVVFDLSVIEPYYRSNKETCIDMRYCLREGSHGDCDGYGIEDDTWLVGLLNEDGSWFREWYIEGD